MRRHSILFVSVILLGCAATPPPPPPAPAAAGYDFPHDTVWTARPEAALRVDSATTIALPHPLTALVVLAADSAGLHVRCLACERNDEGRVGWGSVIFESAAPPDRVRGPLAEFALAVRSAAARRDIDALRQVMSPEFTFAFIGPQGREEAIAAWVDEGYATLDVLPALLDRGLATRDQLLWAAPPAHLLEIGYRGLRAGFRRNAAGEWEWLFLVRGERP